MREKLEYSVMTIREMLLEIFYLYRLHEEKIFVLRTLKYQESLWFVRKFKKI